VSDDAFNLLVSVFCIALAAVLGFLLVMAERLRLALCVVVLLIIFAVLNISLDGGLIAFVVDVARESMS
jgi:hypothetical protein